jgi:hypothetical protein
MQTFKLLLILVNWMPINRVRFSFEFLRISPPRTLLAFLWCMTAASVSTIDVHAGMIIDPSLGQVITSGRTDDLDVAFELNFGSAFQGRLFGIARPNVYVTDNGNLNFVGDTNYFPDPSNTVARVSPFWDDFLILEGLPNQITAFHSPGSYLAASWVKSHLYLDELGGGIFPGTDRSAQVLWMESDASIRGFNFKQDDIAFSYVGHVAGTSNFGPEVFARVSLDDGQGALGKTAILPGSANGHIEFEDGDLLPWRDDEFLLFRWNAGTANYDVSIESFTAVPEPSSLLLVVGFAATGWASKFPRRLLSTRGHKLSSAQ